MIYDVSKLNATKIVIGRRGENLATTIEIDVSAWIKEWPSASLQVVVMRPGDTVPYVTGTSVSDGVLSWPVTDVDTANAGKGKIEVRASSGAVMKKSVIATIEVEPCILCDEDADPPELEPALVDQAIAAAERAEKAAQRVEDGLEWSDVKNKPQAYTPTSHTHGVNEVTGLETALSQHTRVVNLLDNSDFSDPVMQRGSSSHTGVAYGIDRWYGRAIAQTVTPRGIDVTVTATGTSYVGIMQKVLNISKYAGKTLTFACNMYAVAIPRLRFTDANGAELAGIRGTARKQQTVVLTYTVPTDATPDNVIPTILLESTASGDYMRLYWAALYEGTFTVDDLPTYLPKGYGVEMMECQRYYHLYSSQTARPAHGMDCTPPMRLSAPTQGTLSVNGVTYYYNSADL